MENSPIVFSDLKAGRNGQCVVARLLRFWEARNVRKGGQLMGVDMLLLDEKSTLIQASINVNRLPAFKDLMHRGAVYAISHFEVTRSNDHFKLCDSNIAMRFTDLTTFVPDMAPNSSIPKEMFNLHTHDKLLALANTNTYLPDIMGEVCGIKTTQNEATQTTQRIMVQFRLSNGEVVCLSSFDALAVALDQKLESFGEDPKVILATNINPKLVGGKMYLNATSGTHFYFDSDVAPTKNFLEELRAVDGGSSNPIAKYRGVQKLEKVTLCELNEFILKSAPQAVDFLCTSKVTGIQTQNGWRFISCSKCSKKLLRGTSSFTCTVCRNPNAVGVVRYRVELIVSDNNDTAVFVAWDTDMTRLTNVSANDVGTTTDIPHFITDIVGRTFTFQIKLSEYNFTAKHQSFTVSRIIEDPLAVPIATFVSQDEAEETNINIGSTDDKATPNPSDHATTSGPTIADPPTALAKRASKRPRKE